VLRESSGRAASLTHWSFGQLATIAAAPPSYLRTLPATIAAIAINYGLQQQRRDQHQLFVERTAPWTAHAITSPRYARVQHDELAGRVLDLMAQHPAWHLPLGYKDGGESSDAARSYPIAARPSALLRWLRIIGDSVFLIDGRPRGRGTRRAVRSETARS
jgi:hypothetical protein